MKSFWFAAFALTACAAAPLAPPGAATVRVQPAGGVTWPAARGETSLDVRAISRDAQGQETELAGVPCTAESSLYAAEFTAPARVLVPDLGESSPEIVVTCRAGEMVGRAASRPDWAWSGGYGGWPAIGVSVGTGGYDGVGVGLGWYGGGVGSPSGPPATRYPALRVALQ